MKINKLIMTMLLSALLIGSTFVFADAGDVNYNNEAKVLFNLGLLRGSNGGFELDKKPTRVEAAVMLIRFMGKEAEAQAQNYSHPFKDVPNWANPYVGYMYNKGLTKGISTNIYGSEEFIDGNSYATLMIRALGYDDTAGDFKWSTALDFLISKGIITAEDSVAMKKDFKRDEMVGVSYRILDAKYKGNDIKPIEKLINDKAITYETASRYFSIRDEIMVKGSNNSVIDNQASNDVNTKAQIDTQNPRVLKTVDKLTTVNTTIGSEVYLPYQINVKMDDGTDATFKILWDQDQLNGSSYPNYFKGVKSGSFILNGKLYLHEYFEVSIKVNVSSQLTFENPGIEALVKRFVYNKAISEVTLEDLANITKIDIVPKDYGITSLNGIEVFNNLSEISLLGDCSNIDLSGLSKLDNLRSLSVSKASPSKISQMFNIPSLEYLEFDTMRILDSVDGIENLSNLQTLVISDYIKDPSALLSIKDRVDITWMRTGFEAALNTNNETFRVQAINDTYESNEQQAKEIARDIANSITNSSMSDLEKVQSIHDYIVTHVKYDYENFNNDSVPVEDHTLYGALVNGIAVCDGFAEAFDHIATEAGLDTQIIRGNAFSTIYTEKVNHAWNLVMIDGVYRHVDTSSDNLRNFSDPIRYTYSIRTDSEIQNTHWWDRNQYPMAE